MRFIFLLFSMHLLGTTAFSQQVSGSAKDDQGAPISGATISLLKDSTVVKLGITKENGSYTLSNVKPGSYRISASHIGYDDAISEKFEVAGDAVTVPLLQIKKAKVNLANVQVVARKPVIEIKADKTILNVEGTVNAIGSDALDLLRKSPGVTVDKDDNLLMSGKNGVQVYIDGRPTPLSGSDLGNYLKTLQSSQVEAIEIISNPSAKYEAAGNAGIINIRLKKNKSFGTNGTVNGGWNIGTYAKYNAGFSLNYRNQKVNLYGNYGYNKTPVSVKIDIIRTILDTLFDQKGRLQMKNTAHNFKAGADYFIDKMNTVGVIVNGTLASPEVKNRGYTPISYIPDNKVYRTLVADNTNARKTNNINLNLNYSYVNPNGKNLTLNADHGTYDMSSDQYQPNTYYAGNSQTILNQVVYQMIAPTTISINSFKVDYEQNFRKGKLGYGGKLAMVNADNDFQRYNVYSNSKELDRDRSNQFDYKENINAAYINYNRPFKKLQVQAGLRVENTNSKGVSEGLRNTNGTYTKYDSTFQRTYTDLFPSAAFTYTKNQSNQFGLTYSRRIDRPAYQDLNPFENKLDEYTFQKGNINLRPQYTNSFGISHTYKFKLNTAVNYSHVKDMFTQLIDTVERSKGFMSKKNLATQNILSLNVSYPFHYKSFNLFANLNTFYSKYNADFGTGRKINIDAFGLNFFAQNSLRFAKTWTAEMTAFYNAPTVYQGTLKAKSLWSVDAGLQKQVMKGKATVKAAVSDVFKSLEFNATSNFTGQHTNIISRWESRQFKLNFSYRFGSSQVKAARLRNSGAEDEMKRTQSSGGTPGIGQ